MLTGGYESDIETQKWKAARDYENAHRLAFVIATACKTAGTNNKLKLDRRHYAEYVYTRKGSLGPYFKI